MERLEVSGAVRHIYDIRRQINIQWICNLYSKEFRIFKGDFFSIFQRYNKVTGAKLNIRKIKSANARAHIYRCLYISGDIYDDMGPRSDVCVYVYICMSVRVYVCIYVCVYTNVCRYVM
jgi:hypothetical protein